MFLPREKNILKLLWKNEKKITTSEIASELKVSPRTIKADIKRMNEDLKKHSCYIRTKQGVGLWLDYDQNGEYYLELLLYGDNASYVSVDIRKYYVAIEIFLCGKEYISMEYIANKLCVSKGTIVNDIAALETFWKRFSLTLVKKVKYGLKIEGSEFQIRLAFIEALKQATTKEGFAWKNRLQVFLECTDLDQIKNIILESEKRFDFILSEPSFQEFVIQLGVLLERLRNNCFIVKAQYESYQEKKLFEGKRERMEWFVLQYLKGQLTDKTGIIISDEEDIYLRTCLQGLRFQVPLFEENDKEKLRERSPELFDYMMLVIREIDEMYQLKLEEDQELYCLMFNHLECMIHRIQSNLYLENPILSSLKKEMFYEYEIASYFMSKFRKKYGIEATEDEIGYITFYIGTALERMKEKKQKKLSAVLVCSTGVGISQFLSVKLKRLFHELEVKEIISGNQIYRLTPETQDLVISAVPLKREGLEVIQISPLLNETDIQRIQKYIQKEKFSCETSKYMYLKHFLHEEISILNCDLRSKEEVIQLLGSRMCSMGYVDKGYIASVFQREEVSETAVGNRLAIPHAFEGHILRQGIGLLTLQRPVEWGRERVQVVLMLALEASEKTDFQKIFEDVLLLTQNSKDLENLLRAKKYREINIWK